VSVIYRQQELGRIIRHHGGDASAPTHTILDRELKKAFILRKKVHQVRTTQCCFHRKNKKLDDNSFNIFAVKNYGTKENTEEYTSVASICMVDAEIKFNCNEPSEAELGLLEKTLLFATLVSIVRAASHYNTHFITAHKKLHIILSQKFCFRKPKQWNQQASDSGFHTPSNN